MRTALCLVTVVVLAGLPSGQTQATGTNATTTSNPTSGSGTTSTSVPTTTETTTTTTRRPRIRCSHLCPRIYQPVCGRVKGVLKTFVSRCRLRSEARCARRKWLAGLGRRPRIRFLYQGRCRQRIANRRNEDL